MKMVMRAKNGRYCAYNTEGDTVIFQEKDLGTLSKQEWWSKTCWPCKDPLDYIKEGEHTYLFPAEFLE